MSSTCYEIDILAKKALIEVPDHRTFRELKRGGESDHHFFAELRDRVMNLRFDCLPNWGISDLRDADNARKQNWFLFDSDLFDKALFRYHCLDQERLRTMVCCALQDILGVEPLILGIGVYGSFLYGHEDDFDDLDVLVILQTPEDVVIDAIRYRDHRLREVFSNLSGLNANAVDLGMTVIGRKTLSEANHSFLVTEAALLDATITFSSGYCINAPPLTPFLMTLNARKMVKWALGELTASPTKTINLLDQAAKLRNMMCLQYPTIEFQCGDMATFSWASLVRQADTTHYLLEACAELSRLIASDESTIRRLACTIL